MKKNMVVGIAVGCVGVLAAQAAAADNVKVTPLGGQAGECRSAGTGFQGEHGGAVGYVQAGEHE